MDNEETGTSQGEDSDEGVQEGQAPLEVEEGAAGEVAQTGASDSIVGGGTEIV